MSDDENDWNDETEIDVDQWLHVLLAIAGDKERKEKMIRRIAEKTGQPPEQIETIIAAAIKYLANSSRPN